MRNTYKMIKEVMAFQKKRSDDPNEFIEMLAMEEFDKASDLIIKVINDSTISDESWATFIYLYMKLSEIVEEKSDVDSKYVARITRIMKLVEKYQDMDEEFEEEEED